MGNSEVILNLGLPDKYHRNSIEAVVALSASWSDTEWETDCCQVLLRAAQETGINLNNLFRFSSFKILREWN